MANETPESNQNIFSTLKEITQPFIDLFHASRALWGVNLSYLLEGVYLLSGWLVTWSSTFNSYIKLDDISAGQMVGVLTAGITLAMLFPWRNC